MPRKKVELTEEQKVQVEALAAYLTQDQIADFLGVTRKTFSEIIKRDDDVSTRYKKGKSKAVASAAKTVMDAIRAGNLTAAFFYLKTQAGWRETNGVEVTNPDGSMSQLTVTVAGKKPEGEKSAKKTAPKKNKTTKK